MATFFDETPLWGVNTIDILQECVTPKIEELDPPKIEVEDVRKDDINDKEPRGSYVNIEVLQHSNRDL